VHRALTVLDSLVTEAAPMSVAQVATRTGLPAPTAFRLLRTFVEHGYLQQLPDRTYTLGLRLIPLGAAAQRLVGANLDTVLTELVHQLGETANAAIRSGHHAEYIAQVPSPHAMRMFTQVGARVDLHSTGVGKALLAQLDDPAVRSLLPSGAMTRRTPHTITTHTALIDELNRVRQQGFALDDEEQELGVRCLAAAAPTVRGIAISVSGPSPRMTDALLERATPLLLAAASRLEPGSTR